DLYVRVTIAKHPLYERQGDNLIQTLPVDLYTAVLGGKAEVSTFTGKVKISIPPGTQNGKILRLKRKGMPVYGQHNEFGDMLVKIQVKIPERLTPEEKELFERLRTLAVKKTTSYA
ncbi:MAG TPA: DnaJ C-terminal domain-containing protein, partial [Chitinophagales bacterium]|nr:DnaJ C-terminal domain-containing protein [Chitinophagales bacterium]